MTKPDSPCALITTEFQNLFLTRTRIVSFFFFIFFAFLLIILPASGANSSSHYPTTTCDLNSDGLPDQLKLKPGAIQISFSGSSHTQELPLTESPDQILFTDLNRDGHLDLVILTAQPSILIWFNDGRGRFNRSNPGDALSRLNQSEDGDNTEATPPACENPETCPHDLDLLPFICRTCENQTYSLAFARCYFSRPPPALSLS